MVKDDVVNSLIDLGVHLPNIKTFKPEDYGNGNFLNWLNTKFAEIEIDTNFFPMKDEGFILVQEKELCGGS